jgi:hypothetical protein
LLRVVLLGIYSIILLTIPFSLDYDAAIDIAVQRGYNSFAEHLNNLIFEVDTERNGSDEEKNDRSSSILSSDYDHLPIHRDSEVDDDACDSENSLADSNELSSSTRTRDSENRHSIDEETVPDDGVNDMRGELYQAKFALNELVKENDMLKGKLAVYCEDNIESFLVKKSLVELNSIEERVRRSLDRIIRAKEVASSNLEDARVCVICKENPKSVLFLNCRHLCVCNECGHLDILVHCPLCRMEIREKINVYA